MRDENNFMFSEKFLLNYADSLKLLRALGDKMYAKLQLLGTNRCSWQSDLKKKSTLQLTGEKKNKTKNQKQALYMVKLWNHFRDAGRWCSTCICDVKKMSPPPLTRFKINLLQFFFFFFADSNRCTHTRTYNNFNRDLHRM